MHETYTEAKKKKQRFEDELRPRTASIQPDDSKRATT
jgi:hypothetical protein